MRSIAGIAIRGSRVFVARRRPGGDLGGKWEFPGGKCEPGELDSDAAIREFDEEFNLHVDVGETIGGSSFDHCGECYGLAAVLVSFDGEPESLHEHEECLWIDAEGLATLDLADSDRSLLPFVLARLLVA